MSDSPLAAAVSLLTGAAVRVRENGTAIADSDLIADLSATRELSRLVAQIQVETVSGLQRRGAFAAAGYTRPESAVAAVLGVNHRQAREITRAAEHVTARVDLQGQALAPVLPAMAAAFAAGAASLAHVDAIARLLDSPAARRIPPYAWVGIEEQIAAETDRATPDELRRFGTQLVQAYDQDGAEPDDREPAQVNELRLAPLPGGGGKIAGVFEDPVRYSMIATVLDAKSTPLTAEDQRSAPERAADALAEVCGFVADHGDDVLPAVGGQRPHISVTVALDDLERRARAACLDFGGTPTPAALRALCCDAAVIPVVLDGAGQPLDVGRAQRTISPAIRRAVTARDRGCAHPGCDRPPSWCEIHHIREWSRGGHTRLDNLVMLCRAHHREIHSSEWVVRVGRDGIPEFVPPPWIDKSQTPRRHPRKRQRVSRTTAPPGRPPRSRPPRTARHRSGDNAPR